MSSWWKHQGNHCMYHVGCWTFRKYNAFFPSGNNVQSACTNFFSPTEQVQKQVLSLRKKKKKERCVSLHWSEICWCNIIRPERLNSPHSFTHTHTTLCTGGIQYSYRAAEQLSLFHLPSKVFKGSLSLLQEWKRHRVCMSLWTDWLEFTKSHDLGFFPFHHLMSRVLLTVSLWTGRTTVNRCVVNL